MMGDLVGNYMTEQAFANGVWDSPMEKSMKKLKVKQEMLDRVKSASAKERMIMLFRMIEKFGVDAETVIGSVEIIPFDDHRMTDGVIPASVVRGVCHTAHVKNKIQAIKELRAFTKSEFGSTTGLKECKEVVESWLELYGEAIPAIGDYEVVADQTITGIDDLGNVKDVGVPDGYKSITVPVRLKDGTKVGEDIINVREDCHEKFTVIKDEAGTLTVLESEWEKLKNKILNESSKVPPVETHHIKK